MLSWTGAKIATERLRLLSQQNVVGTKRENKADLSWMGNRAAGAYYLCAG